MNTIRKRRAYPWRRRRRRFLAVVLLVFGIVLGVGVGYRASLERRVRAELQAIRDAGYPATFEEMRANYPEPPPGENAAELYQQASEVRIQGTPGAGYQAISDTMKEEPEGQRFSEALRDMVRAYMAANAEKLRLLHEAAMRPISRFPIDLSEGFAMKLPHLAQLRDSARLLQLEAMLAADEGDTQRAVDALLAALAVGESLRDEPIVISQLVRNACSGITQTALGYALSVASFDEQQLERLGAAFARAEDPSALTRALATERIFGLSAYDHPELLLADGGDPTLDRFVPGGTLTAVRVAEMVGFQARDRLRYLDYMGQLIEASTRPTWEAIPQAARIGDGMEDFLIPRMSQAMVPGLARVMYSQGQGLASERCAQAAVAVERYRLVYGTAPEQLEDLVPSFLGAVPTDPFDGAPLRYRTEGDGYLVYSVGYNQRDDGGVEHTGGQSHYQFGDWVLRIHR